jgi:predicted Rossmann-fold nucleotide-binding protein
VARQLGDHRKPIAIVNHERYYDPLVAMIEHGIEHRFVRPAIRGVLSVVPTGHDAIDALLAHRPVEHDPSQFLPMHAGRDR